MIHSSLRTNHRYRVLLACALGAFLALSVLLAISWGAASIPVGRTATYLWSALTGGPISSSDVTEYTVVAEIRTPRAVMAAVVGAGLSALGIAAQAMVRNPLADPFILSLIHI